MINALELDLGQIPASALAELLELTARAMHSRGFAENLFPAQWVALRYFARAPAERCTASDLARFQGLANGAVSRTVRTMLEKDLLAKALDQPRGRSERLEVTTAGKEILKKDPMSELQVVLADLDEGDREVLARSLESVLRRFSATQE